MQRACCAIAGVEAARACCWREGARTPPEPASCVRLGASTSTYLLPRLLRLLGLLCRSYEEIHGLKELFKR